MKLTILILVLFIAIIGLFALYNNPSNYSLNTEHFIPTKIPTSFTGEEIAKRINSKYIDPNGQNFIGNNLEATININNNSKGYKYWRQVEIKKINLNDETHPLDENGTWCWFIYGGYEIKSKNPLNYIFGVPRDTENYIKNIKNEVMNW